MTGDDFLETLQADLVAILKATPSLEAVNIIPEDDGDMEAMIMRSLGTLKGGSTNKAGSVAVVMLPAVTEAEANLPGPPLTVSVKVQVIEQSIVNRAAAGSGVRSSEGALRVLNALHHHGLAYAALYAGRNPVEPVEVKKGFLSHMVSLTLQFRGLEGPGKPAAVAAAMGATLPETIQVSGTLATPFHGAIVFPDLIYAGLALGRGSWSDSGLAVIGEPYSLAWVATNEWVLVANAQGARWSSSSDVMDPRDATGWTPLYNPGTDETPTGTPSIAGTGSVAPALTLTCATSGSAIRYTTDGSYPSPAKTLYTAPITGLAAGTIVRAAAYKTGLNPGNVTELLITD